MQHPRRPGRQYDTGMHGAWSGKQLNSFGFINSGFLYRQVAVAPRH